MDGGNHGHAKATFLNRNPARLLEQLVAVMHPNDQRIDAAQHGIHAVEVCDPVLRSLELLGIGLLISNVSGDACDAHDLVGVVPDRKTSHLDPANRAIRAHHPKLELGLACRHDLPVFFVGRRPIIRVDRFGPRLRIRVQAFAAAAPDLFVGWADIQHAFAIHIDEEEHVTDVLRHLTESLFAVNQRRLGSLIGRAHLRFFQFAFQRRRKPSQARLHHVVAGAGLHRGHGGGLADGAGNEDERNIEAGRAENSERIQAGESRHAEIRDDCVPALLRQRALQVRRRLDTLVRRVEPAAMQRPQCQYCVVFGVLDDEDFDRLVHVALRSGGG